MATTRRGSERGDASSEPEPEPDAEPARFRFWYSLTVLRRPSDDAGSTAATAASAASASGPITPPQRTPRGVDSERRQRQPRPRRVARRRRRRRDGALGVRRLRMRVRAVLGRLLAAAAAGERALAVGELGQGGAELLELAGRLLLQGGAELLDVRVDAAAEVDHLRRDESAVRGIWARIAPELRGVCAAPAAGSPA